MTIKVSPSRLLEEKQNCKTFANNMQVIHDTLNKQFSNYHTWQSDSSCDAFNQMWARWGSVVIDMHVAFENLQGYLAEAALVYEQTDTNVSNSIQNQAK